MSFAILKLIFAALVVSLVVVLAVVGRRVLSRRTAETPEPAGAASGIKLPKLRKAEPAAAPPADEPAPVRRRQLASFAEEGRLAAADDEQPVELAAVAETETTPVEDAPAPDERQPFDQAVLARLEQAFEGFQSGEMTLAGYAERLRGEEAAVEERIEAIGAGGNPAELEAAHAARESVRWCLDWVKEQEEAAGEA